MEDRIRVRSEEILSDDWAILKKTVLDYRRRDGQWETQIRQTYDRGDGAVILPYDPLRSTVLLVRQFRYPAYVTGHREPLIEACAGLLDENDPETAIRKEAEEELGYRLKDIERLFSPYMSPGSVTERLWFFIGRYS
ncbi:NUDIX domain-containing protein, partial [Mesorhizobium sp. M7A.F.Ca.CA.001.04.1.1]